MASNSNSELILKSIMELRSNRKHPGHAAVISYAEKHYSLSTDVGHKSLYSLLENGAVFNKPKKAGLASLFVNDDFLEHRVAHQPNGSLPSSLQFQTKESQTTNDLSQQPSSKMSFDIYQSFAKLARTVVDIQSLLEKERELNRSLEKQIFELRGESWKTTIEKDIHSRCDNHSNLSTANKENFTKEQRTPIVYEDIHSETSTAIANGRIKSKGQKAKKKQIRSSLASKEESMAESKSLEANKNRVSSDSKRRNGRTTTMGEENQQILQKQEGNRTNREKC